MLTGQKPFSAKTPMALALRHAHELPPTPSSLLPFAPVPGPVEQLVMKLLEKAPERRPPDAAALLVAIDALQDAAEQANTPISTIKDLSPSESTVTSLETPGTHVARLALAASTASDVAPSSTVVTPSPALAVAPPSASRALTPRQGIAAGLALVVVVTAGALWAAGGRERRGVRPTAAPFGPAVFGGSNASPAPTVANIVQPVSSESFGKEADPAQEQAGGDPATTPPVQTAPIAPGGTPPPAPPPSPALGNPWTQADTTKPRSPRRLRDKTGEPVAVEPRTCTVSAMATSAGWEIAVKMRRWRELPQRIELAPGPQSLSFRRVGSDEVRQVPFDVPAEGPCSYVWGG